MIEKMEPNGTVLYSLHRNIATVTLNRPEKRNAVNGDMTKGLDACLERTEGDPHVRVVILCSSSEAFCAGGDLVEVAEGQFDGMNTDKGGFAGLVHYPRTRPWIAATRGPVLAGGLELCLACDMIVAGDDCLFGLPEVKRSFIAAAGGLARLPKRIPLNIAVQMLVSGEPIDARRAYSLGLVNEVVPSDEVLSAATRLAEAIARNAPLAVRETVQIARKAKELSDTECRRIVDEAMSKLQKTADFAEGAQAFVNKRRPNWTGS